MNNVMQASTQNDKRNIITVDQNYTYMFKNYSEYEPIKSYKME